MHIYWSRQPRVFRHLTSFLLLLVSLPISLIITFWQMLSYDTCTQTLSLISLIEWPRNLFTRIKHWIKNSFTFLPEASFDLWVLSLPACVCLSVCQCVCLSVCLCVSVNQELVRAITHDPFKLVSPHFNQRCKTTWLRSLLFWDDQFDVQGKIWLQSQILPNSEIEVLRMITHHLFKLESPNFGPKVRNTLHKIPIVLGRVHH